MKIERRDPNDEKLILSGIITDTSVLASLAERWDGNLFRSKWSNLVAGWAVDYYSKYENAPGQDISNIYELWAADQAEGDKQVDLIGRFLSGLSEDWAKRKKPPSSKYILDVAGRYFSRIACQRLAEDIDTHLTVGDIAQAEEAISKYKAPILDEGHSINVLSDASAIKLAFKTTLQPIIEYPGAAGEFFNASLVREGFVSFMGQEKVGKSFMLQDMAWLAMLQKRRVAFFAIGDMSEADMLLRFMVRASCWPDTAQQCHIPSSISRPRRGGSVDIIHRIRDYPKPLSYKRAMRACQKILDGPLEGTEYLRLSTHPNSSIGLPGIRSIVDRWARNGWLPDVIVIDYADLLARLPGYENRDSINESWKLMRALCQTYHCLLITATQADANAYNKSGLLDMSNFSEDKRKFSHVTAMFGINPPKNGEHEDLRRFNCLVIRHRKRPKTLITAGCLAVGQPIMVSTS